MAERKKAPRLTTPRVILKFPKLDKPDYGTKEYAKPAGEYSTQALMKADDPTTKAFIATLTPYYDEAIRWAHEQFKGLKVETRKRIGKVSENPLFGTIYDKETEEPTGEISFKFAMPASGIRDKDTPKEAKWTAKPGLFDAKGNPIVKVPQIWSGTVAKVSFEIGLNKDGGPGYFIPGTGAAGLKLKLKGVQIIDLRSGGQANADAYGFGSEDGYEYEEPADDGLGDTENLSGPSAGTPEEEDF